ncbi:WG repeat-containing protein [Thomasclavelia saccharogumia]|uniref:WG repeat-containing protein n=1 Tax=Thomasclavelia saccharogumia TaxID=341225 RepID=UPI0004788931|nr:WG repeat-containing protein [Thomasclavelia saccharogumia]
MNKDIRYITILIIGISLLGIISFVKNFNNVDAAYNENVALGDKAYKKEIYIDAIEYYSEAVNSKPSNMDIRLKLADSYLKLGNNSQFETILKNTIDLDAENETAYLKLAKYYAKTENYQEAYKTLLDAKNVKNRKEIDELLESYKSFYRVVGAYVDDVKQWRNSYLPIKKGETWGLLNNTGNLVIESIYQEIGCFSNEEKVTPVYDGSQWYYIDENGYKKLVGDHEYSYLGNFANGYAPACYNEKYGWIDRDFNEYKMEYDYTTAFCNGIAAAKKGDKWALIDKNLKQLTKFKFDEIVLDENGFCANGESIFVKEKDKYYLIDGDGKRIGKLEFDDVKAFNGNQYAAVKKGNEWGYVNTEGKLAIKYQYEDACSFANGVAGYKDHGAWGVIDQNNEVILVPMFNEVKTMNSDGILAVKNEEIWQCVQLYAFMKYD